MLPVDPTRRFFDRVADYVRYRPGYPEALLRTLIDETGLGTGSAVADIGSGTGISAALLLRSGCRVYGVEPNPEMRHAAEEQLACEPRFTSVAGSAEATTLPDASIDLVAAGQAFHWFDRGRARGEFVRILRPHRQVALFWNARRSESTPFLRAYESLLLRFGTDYRQVDHTRLGREVFDRFFDGPYAGRRFPNEQVLDFAGLRGRLLSSSYAPAPGHPDHEPMLDELRRIFDRCQDDGHVRLEYETELYLGTLAHERRSA
ncbi:MAG: class I SAM-dependent methyltransferase [Thermoanaerobaculia bacterium]